MAHHHRLGKLTGVSWLATPRSAFLQVDVPIRGLVSGAMHPLFDPVVRCSRHVLGTPGAASLPTPPRVGDGTRALSKPRHDPGPPPC